MGLKVIVYGEKVIVYGEALENLRQQPKDSPFSRQSNSLKGDSLWG